MDVELFLEGQTRWEEDSQHWLVMLYEMFKHATNEGQKEVECMVCWGCQQGLPKLDPEVDLSAIQLVGPETLKEEIVSLYLKVYKQQRLPGSPPRKPELTEEVVSSFEGCKRQKEVEDTYCHCKTPICQCPALKEESSWEEGDTNRKELSSHKGCPPEDTGCCCCPWGRDREAELPPPPESAGGKGKVKE